ncbi:Apc13p protein-domain-containing protein [Cladorrhinum sp. PSN332]|nr:Apc13p protein-domain-containing protein [Cladorrhinum sp. PSN332]
MNHGHDNVPGDNSFVNAWLPPAVLWRPPRPLTQEERQALQQRQVLQHRLNPPTRRLRTFYLSDNNLDTVNLSPPGSDSTDATIEIPIFDEEDNEQPAAPESGPGPFQPTAQELEDVAFLNSLPAIAPPMLRADTYNPIPDSSMNKDAAYTYVHMTSSRTADIFEDFCKDKLPADDIYVPPHLQPINPEDEDDVVPDQHAAFGITQATQKSKQTAWKDLNLASLMNRGPGGGPHGGTSSATGGRAGASGNARRRGGGGGGAAAGSAYKGLPR